jgi:hypothetical protein
MRRWIARHTALVRDIEPLPDEFSGVTRAGRFHVLHQAADTLLDELQEQYAVDRRETKEPASRQPDAPVVRVVRLMPRSPAASQLSVAFTDFPGVVLRLGRWYEDAFPSCGCDACDESPDDLVEDLHIRVAAHVEGGLWERIRRGLTTSWIETRLIAPGFRTSRQSPVSAYEARAARREGFAAAVQWGPWPRRRHGGTTGS